MNRDTPSIAAAATARPGTAATATARSRAAGKAQAPSRATPTRVATPTQAATTSTTATRALLLAAALLLALGNLPGALPATAVATLPLQAQTTPPNPLTEAEVAAGWRLLFDGTLNGWRGYREGQVLPAWSVEDGTLAFTPGDGGADLITVEQFGDFELAFEWRVGPGGNSGVFYRVTEEEVAPYWTGPEYQVLDNAGHRDGGNPRTSAGSNYGLHAPLRDVTRPAGEWNTARIVLRDNQVEHWMNGEKLLEYELRSQEWREVVARTKFSDWPRYGMAARGHIGLQDHGDPVWYRNIRIRDRIGEEPGR